MTDTLRVGAIGAGRVFHDAHVPVYAGMNGVRLTALYDPDRSAAERARDHYLKLRAQTAAGERAEVALCETPEALLAQVEVVDICSTVRWHAYYAAMALERGVHTMTEKPMARTWWEAHHVAGLRRQSTALFQLNDDNLFIPRYQAMRHVVESGMIGEVQNVWIARGYPGSGRKAWFWDSLEAGGGCIMDYGSHAVASTWFLAGFDKDPTEVRSLRIGVRNRTRFIEGRLRTIEIDDDAHFKVRFVDPRNGDWINAAIEATWTWPEWGQDGSDVRGYVEIEGSEGSVTGYVDDQDRDYLRVRNRSGGERDLPIPGARTEDESFKAEIGNFVECVRAGEKSILDAERGAAIMAVINCAQLSELRGRAAVTPADLEAFSRELADGAPDPWKAGDRIAAALNAPYRMS